MYFLEFFFHHFSIQILSPTSPSAHFSSKITQHTTFPSACFTIPSSPSSSSSSTSLVTSIKVSQPLPSFKSSTSFTSLTLSSTFPSHFGLLSYYFYLLHSPILFFSRQTCFVSSHLKNKKKTTSPLS